MYSTADFIAAFRHRVSTSGLTLYYETVHANADMPYCIISDVNKSTPEPFETIFDVTIDVWGESRMGIETLCDQLLAALDTGLISIGSAYGHIVFNGQQTIDETEGDLIRRQQMYSARIFG